MLTPALPALLLAALASSAPEPAPLDTMLDVGGYRLHLEVRRGTLPITLVLEAGGAAGLGAWADVPARLAAETGATVVAYDRAGLGRSEPGPAGLTPEDEVHALHRALGALGVPPRTVLVAHSYGAVLALLHAGLRPDAVAGLALVDPMNPRFVRATGDFVAGTAPRIPAPATERERVIVRMQRTLDALIGATGAIEPRLRLPVVVVTAGEAWWGRPEIDRAWRASHAAMAAEPGRSLLVAEGARHDVPGQRPEAVIAAVRRVLEALGVRWPKSTP